MDQFQGRDKDVIVYSCTRSRQVEGVAESDCTNQDRSGDILADLRRLNVALTRARRKLVLVGDKATLSHSYPDTFGKLFGILQNQDIVDVSS